MNSSHHSHPSHSQSGACPYNDLYIYQLGGRLTSQTGIHPECFIGNWEDDDFSFLFYSDPVPEEIEKLLRSQPHLTYMDNYHMSYEQWQGSILTTFDQGCFRVIPPWERDAVGMHTQQPIILDPGLVFGTGTHPTTRDCLDAVELAVWEKTTEVVLDLGTGTGLLALATARLGCKINLAVDLNLLAAKTAVKNVRLNDLESQVTVVQGYAEDFIACPADLLIANIHYDVMKKLIRAESFVSKKRFILSGLLRSEAKQVRIELEHLSAKIIKSWTQEGIWHTFYGEIGNYESHITF
jgi:ribosomal protein L11 methyltransferase